MAATRQKEARNQGPRTARNSSVGEVYGAKMKLVKQSDPREREMPIDRHERAEGRAVIPLQGISRSRVKLSRINKKLKSINFRRVGIHEEG